MSNDTTHNGWTNYATWRVNLEMFDSISLGDVCVLDTSNVHEVADNLKDTAEQLIEDGSAEGLARDYALAFLSDVNWHEIAQHLINDANEE